MKEKNKNQRGITLVSLTITIIVLLILTGITLNGIFGNNGIISNSLSAKEKNEIASEKEIIGNAKTLAEGVGITGIITEEKLQTAIDSITGKDEATAMGNGETIVVKFINSNRYYEIDDKGNVNGPRYYKADDYAGDLTKGSKYDGSEGKPFQIACIEDLVVFSIMTNGGNSQLGLASNKFSGKNVELVTTLDFNSIFSYSDYTTTIYGDLNTDGVVEGIKKELTKTEEGCIGFLPINSFSGTFDGNGNFIENIYQKNIIESKRLGLFIGTSTTGIIKNLNLTGTIINTKWEAAGIFAGANGKVDISNCKNYANITGYNMVGGIRGWTHGTTSDCSNYGAITITGKSYQYGGAGGIAAYIVGKNTIQGCTNEGKVLGTVTRAGIVRNFRWW